MAADLNLVSILLDSVLPATIGSAVGGAAVFISATKVRKRPREFWIRQTFYLIASPIVAFFIFREADPKNAFLVGATLPVAAQQLSRFALRGFENERTASLRATITRAEEEVEKQPERTKPVWDLSRASLELYIQRNLSQVRNIFWALR